MCLFVCLLVCFNKFWRACYFVCVCVFCFFFFVCVCVVCVTLCVCVCVCCCCLCVRVCVVLFFFHIAAFQLQLWPSTDTIAMEGNVSDLKVDR